MVTDIRLQMHKCGYHPLPLDGKVCWLRGWQQKTGTRAEEIQSWAVVRPDWSNTGALTRWMPTIDLDILNPEAAYIAEDIVRRRYEGRGHILVRIGRAPKRAIPFKLSGAPFKKIEVKFIGPAKEKIEFLGDGQLIAVAGLHPGIGQPYRWMGGQLWQTARDELPSISEAEAHELVDEIVEMLTSEFGYRLAEPQRKTPTAGTLMEWRPAQGRAELPKELYFKVCRLASGRNKRRIVGLLTVLVEKTEGRNHALNTIGFAFRELIEDGIIGREDAESLLIEAAGLNGYIRKDGIGAATDTIRSALGH
jgi:hypothetical protein